MMKKLEYIIITLFLLQLAACLSCQMLTYDLDGIEKPFLLWLKEGTVQKFVSNKNDTTIFTITKIEKKKMKPSMNIPILGGGDFFHAPTNFYIHCKISGDTQSMKQKNGLYIYREKDNDLRVGVYFRFGGQSDFRWGFVDGRVLEKGIGLTFSYPVAIGGRIFEDTEFFKRKNNEGNGIVSYIWSKHYGLLQYTTADSLVWTRINIEEPEE